MLKHKFLAGEFYLGHRGVPHHFFLLITKKKRKERKNIPGGSVDFCSV